MGFNTISIHVKGFDFDLDLADLDKIPFDKILEGLDKIKDALLR